MKNLRLLIILLVLICVFSVSFVFAKSKMRDENAIMSSWLEWKTKHIDDPKKKKIVEYLTKIDASFDVAKETQFITNQSDYGDPNPANAVKIIETSLRNTKKLKVPTECKYYRELNIRILQLIKSYQKARLKFGENQFFWNAIMKTHIDQIKLESDREKEYFTILRKIGFYDHMLDEMVELKLISKEEKNKFDIDSEKK